MILAIETSVREGSISLLVDGKEIGYRCFGKEESMSQFLLAGIEELLIKAGVKKSDLKIVVVSNGPGSLTGIRIGISVGVGLAFALGIECLGVPLLEVIKPDILRRLVVSVIPAGRNRSYWQIFDGKRRKNSVNLINNEEIKSLVKENPTALFVVESGLSDFMQGILPEDRLMIAPKNLAGLIGQKAFEMIKVGIFPKSVPLYIEETSFRKTEQIEAF